MFAYFTLFAYITLFAYFKNGNRLIYEWKLLILGMVIAYFTNGNCFFFPMVNCLPYMG